MDIWYQKIIYYVFCHLLGLSTVGTQFRSYFKNHTFTKSYLAICVLVLKSRDLIERKTSMHPKYCKEKETVGKYIIIILEFWEKMQLIIKRHCTILIFTFDLSYVSGRFLWLRSCMSQIYSINILFHLSLKFGSTYLFTFNLITVIYLVHNVLMCFLIFLYLKCSILDTKLIKVKNNINEKGSVVKQIHLALISMKIIFKRERTKPH